MKRILVAEDNDVNAKILIAMLEGTYKVEHARNGHEAVQMATSQSYDLILMDLEMPELDGWEATRRLRRNPKLLLVPIIATSAHVSPSDWETAELAGCNDYVTKPYQKDELLEKVAKYL